MSFFSQMYDLFYQAFIQNGRYMLYITGLGQTLLMAAGATVLGVVIGTLVAIVKVYALDNRMLKPLEVLADMYIGFIRGTPIIVQLFIIYFSIFKWVPGEYAVLVAILAFGLNSGGYVAEIIRAGIMSVDRGQMEAGRSLGLSKNTAMRFIVLPQAVKNILPPLFNEFIMLVKETSVASFIAIKELTYAATIVSSRTYVKDPPLYIIALMYLVVVLGLTALQKTLERRMAASDKR